MSCTIMITHSTSRYIIQAAQCKKTAWQGFGHQMAPQDAMMLLYIIHLSDVPIVMKMLDIQNFCLK